MVLHPEDCRQTISLSRQTRFFEKTLHRPGLVEICLKCFQSVSWCTCIQWKNTYLQEYIIMVGWGYIIAVQSLVTSLCSMYVCYQNTFHWPWWWPHGGYTAWLQTGAGSLHSQTQPSSRQVYLHSEACTERLSHCMYGQWEGWCKWSISVANTCLSSCDVVEDSSVLK